MAVQSETQMLGTDHVASPRVESPKEVSGGVILGSYIAAVLFPIVGFFMASYLHRSGKQDQAIGVAVVGGVAFLINLLLFLSGEV